MYVQCFSSSVHDFCKSAHEVVISQLPHKLKRDWFDSCYLNATNETTRWFNRMIPNFAVVAMLCDHKLPPPACYYNQKAPGKVWELAQLQTKTIFVQPFLHFLQEREVCVFRQGTV